MTLTPELLIAATGCALKGADVLAHFLDAAMVRFGIDTPIRRAHFLGQTAYESGRFVLVEENLNYSADRLLAVFPRYFSTLAMAHAAEHQPAAIANIVYANRIGNGPTSSGDGWRFRGRGFIQITGRSNYTSLNRDVPDIACLTYPESLAATEYAALSAAWYWSTRHCNDAADSGLVARVTQLINGGLNGLSERTALTRKALAALGVRS